MTKPSVARTPPPRESAERLYQAAVRRGRAPEIYAAMGAPDTIEGRFEVLTLHIILLLHRLRALAAGAAAQALFDAYVSHLDGAMREMGVGDLAMGKRMRNLGEIFYGRAKAYDAAIAALPDRAAFAAVVSRTILDGTPGSDPAPLVAYATERLEALAAQPLAALLTGDVAW